VKGPPTTARIRRAAALGLAVLAVTLGACGSGSAEPTPAPSPSRTAASPTASPTPSPSPTPSLSAPPAATATPDGEAEDRAVNDAVARYYAEYSRISRDPESDLLDIYNVAIEPQSERAYAQLAGVREAGQVQTGDIAATVAAHIDGDLPNTFIADVCVDTTAADILDAEGDSVWATHDLRRTWASIWITQMGAVYAVSDVQPHLDMAC
jgi:hypothetical protein